MFEKIFPPMLYLFSRRFPAVLSNIVMVVIMGLSAGCGTIEKWMDDTTGNQILEYKQARSAPDLEVPPDLTTSRIDDHMTVPDLGPTASGSASLSDYTRERSGTVAAALRSANRGEVLPQPEKIRVLGDGDKKWLLVQDPADDVWAVVRDFWVSNGWLMKLEDPRIGIMETEWAENRAGIPTGFIRDFLGGAFGSLYDAGTRDKFRVRLERGDRSGTTEVYLTHYGAEEQFDGSGDVTRWILRPRDPELEVEMLRRLVLHLGVEEQHGSALLASAERAPGKPRATRIKAGDGASALRLDGEGFGRAWRLVGLVLDRTGFVVEDRDRKEGLYYVRYVDPLREEEQEGILESLAFWRQQEQPDTRYRIHIRTRNGVTLVRILDGEGIPENSKTGDRILELLHEKLQ